MLQLFRNPQLFQQLSLNHVIQCLNAWEMPQPITEGTYTGFHAYSLRNNYLCLLIISKLSGFDVSSILTHSSLKRSVQASLWLAIIISRDTNLIRSLTENIISPTADTWILYPAEDPGLPEPLMRLLDIADIQFVTFDAAANVNHAWIKLRDHIGYIDYIEAGSNSSHAVQPRR